MQMILLFLNKNISVKSFTAGIIIPKHPPSRTDGPTKVTLTENALRISVNSKRSKQEIYVYGTQLETVAQELSKYLNVNNLKSRVIL